ncbi:sugar phosphate isomerase/epimerase family protein [Cohnella hashimotonis]|uniref:Sugar phosphate isomerase/epimerase family protein n=1 Tax=Cohnella hashimotonis TaxID=2826895 RepID=A0ABT6TP74_9BACL|nr:sugar phosphate isomerase/epimerase family protein [Cohnella hashimotonis]MDI4648652.1 sugar phosphate isomerase/epimerase family protein [Cohnella hashimotonis]
MTAQFKYAVSTYALMELPLQEAVDALLEGPWNAIEVMCEGPHGELLDWPAERLARLRDAGKARGISWSLHAPITGLNPAAHEAGEARAAAAALERTLDVAERLDARYIVLHPGVAEGEAIGRAEAGHREALAVRVADMLKRALEASGDSRVAIGLENVPPYPGLLGTDVEFLLRVAELTSSPRVGVVFDTGHAHMMGEGRCLAALRQALPRLIGLHLSDNGGDSDEHLRLGAGTIPLSEAIGLLRAAGYAGAWTLEMRSLPDAVMSAAWLAERLRASDSLADVR